MSEVASESFRTGLYARELLPTMLNTRILIYKQFQLGFSTKNCLAGRQICVLFFLQLKKQQTYKRRNYNYILL